MNIKLLKAQSILQEALQEALFDLEDNRIKNIAVTRVECTQGKELARVFLDKNSLGDMEATNALKLLKKASGAIRANLQAQLSWYKTPNLVFEIDDSLEKINKLENIFKKIHSKDKNSSLGAPFALGENFGEQQTPSLVLSPKFSTNTKLPPQILELDSNNNNSSKSNESSLRGRIADLHEAIQKNQSRVSATKSRPIRGAKNRNQTSSSASADFLLESELRGSPPKSEKRQLLARRGSGAGGAALLRKEKAESKSKEIVGNSRIAKMDCHESANAESRNDKAKSPQDEFATRN